MGDQTGATTEAFILVDEVWVGDLRNGLWVRTYNLPRNGYFADLYSESPDLAVFNRIPGSWHADNFHDAKRMGMQAAKKWCQDAGIVPLGQTQLEFSLLSTLTDLAHQVAHPENQHGDDSTT